MKNFLKSLLRIAIAFFVIVTILAVLMGDGGMSSHKKQIQEAQDKTRIQDIIQISKSITDNTTKIPKIYNVRGYELRDSKTCYYFSRLESGSGYVLAARLESAKYQKEYNNRFYIYKKPDNFTLSESQLKDMNLITSKPCNPVKY